MVSVRQLSITADQIDCKISDADQRIRKALDRFDNPQTPGEIDAAIADIERAYRDKLSWGKVGAAYKKLVA